MITPLPFRIDGRDLEIRAMPASEAYDIAASGNWLLIFPEALAEEDREWVWGRFDDVGDLLTIRSLWRIWHGLAPRIYGVEWWVANRLAATRAASWLSFESWSVRKAFDPDAPWVSPRRMTAALMTWLASTCEKEVEWQQLSAEIQAPPEYALYLPEQEAEAGSIDVSTFQANAPHWVSKTQQQPQGDAVSAGEETEGEDDHGAAEEKPAEAALPWASQPAMTMDQFTQQARSWAQARRKEPGPDSEPSPPGSA